MVVSMLRPALMAHREQPAPRWQLISRRGRRSGPGEAGGHHLGDVLVAKAMEAEAPQPLAAPLGGDGIGGGLGRQGGVEGGIEAGPLLQLRLLGRQPVHHPQCRAIVQGSQGHQFR